VKRGVDAELKKSWKGWTTTLPTKPSQRWFKLTLSCPMEPCEVFEVPGEGLFVETMSSRVSKPVSKMTGSIWGPKLVRPKEP